MRCFRLALIPFLLAMALSARAGDESFFKRDPKVIMVEAAERARALQFRDSRLQAEYGRAYLASGDRKKAEETFSVALLLDPKDAGTHALIARAWFMNGFEKEGLAALEPLRTQPLRHSDGYLEAATLLLEFRSVEEAEAMMERNSALHKDEWQDDFAFADLLQRMGRSDRAAFWLRRGAPAEDAADELVQRALALVKAGHAKEASEAMEAGDPKSKHHQEDCERFGMACNEAFEPDLGAAWLRRAHLSPNPKDNNLRAGIVALKAGDIREAQACFKAAHDIAPKDAATCRFAAKAWFHQGSKEAALKALEPVFSGQTNGKGDLAGAALDLMEAGETDKAMTFAEQAWTLDPRRWEDFLHIGEACLQAHHLSQSLIWLKRGAQKKDAKENLIRDAIELLDGGHAQEAREVMEWTYALDQMDWENCCEFGRAAIRNGDLPLAARYFAFATASYPREERMWNEIALAYADGGKGTRFHFWLQ